jgi:hypothetical protein
LSFLPKDSEGAHELATPETWEEVTAPHIEVAEEVGTEGVKEILPLYIDEWWWKVRNE